MTINPWSDRSNSIVFLSEKYWTSIYWLFMFYFISRPIFFDCANWWIDHDRSGRSGALWTYWTSWWSMNASFTWAMCCNDIWIWTCRSWVASSHCKQHLQKDDLIELFIILTGFSNVEGGSSIGTGPDEAALDSVILSVICSWYCLEEGRLVEVIDRLEFDAEYVLVDCSSRMSSGLCSWIVSSLSSESELPSDDDSSSLSLIPIAKCRF